VAKAAQGSDQIPSVNAYAGSQADNRGGVEGKNHRVLSMRQSGLLRGKPGSRFESQLLSLSCRNPKVGARLSKIFHDRCSGANDNFGDHLDPLHDASAYTDENAFP
jgi:hypothetical protein